MKPERLAEIEKTFRDTGRVGAPAIDELLEEIKSLQAIVDKLPKCWRLNEAGALVQDMPVVIGMEVWVRNKQTIIRKRQVFAITSTSAGDGYHSHWPLGNCYSTEAAARASGEEA